MLIYIFGPSMIAIRQPLLANLAMVADGRGGAPLLIIFEFSMMHLITTDKQFISKKKERNSIQL
jgi:hypothetical protein